MKRAKAIPTMQLRIPQDDGEVGHRVASAATPERRFNTHEEYVAAGTGGMLGFSDQMCVLRSLISDFSMNARDTEVSMIPLDAANNIPLHALRSQTIVVVDVQPNLLVLNPNFSLTNPPLMHLPN
jgi:hypothetical protein